MTRASVRGVPQKRCQSSKIECSYCSIALLAPLRDSLLTKVTLQHPDTHTVRTLSGTQQ